MPSETDIRPFRVGFPDEEVAELRRRIVATRWPERETVTDDSQGVRLAMMQDLAGYWATAYDWRTCEKKLNDLPNFVTEIDGLDIHFIHVRSQHEDALPLIVGTARPLLRRDARSVPVTALDGPRGWPDGECWRLAPGP